MFRSPEESAAWAIFFASQCPNLPNVRPEHVEANMAVGALAADAMLTEFRKRVLVEEAAAETPRETPKAKRRKKVVEVPAPAEGNADYGTGDGENYR